MSVHQLSLQHTQPSAPSTTRGVTTPLSAFGNVLAYGSGNNVVVRDMDRAGSVIICGRHTSSVTAVRISPSGRLVASGDQNGNVLLWVLQSDTREILNTKQLQGPVRDIAWTNDEERLVIVGDGKSIFATAISNSGNTIGTINGHTQNILSCDMRGDRPYRIVTGGADSMVGFYEGVPFKFKCNVKGHKEKVTCVRYSPNMEMIATVSRSGEIILLDGKTAEQKMSIATGHTGSIYSVAWSPDGTKLATASADKSVKLFNASTGAAISTCSLGNSVMDMQQGIVYTPRGIFSSSFGGKLTLVGEEGSTKSVIYGHQGRIFLLHSDSNGILVSVGVDRALIWKDTGDSAWTACQVPLAVDVVIAAAACQAGYIYLVTGTELIRCSLADAAELTVLSKKVVNMTALTVTANENVVILSKNAFVVVETSLSASSPGSTVAEVKLDKFDGISAAAHNDMVALGGDKLVKLYRVAVAAAPEECIQFSGHHTGMVACVTFSKDGQRVASGDASRNIFVWSANDGSVLYKDLVFHTLRVTALAFSPKNNALLFSGSVDASLIVWDLEKKTRKTEDAAHRGGVSAVTWSEEDRLISSGADFCLRQWTLPH